jgi:uncharacterized RDD family membrane protein YckC
MATTEHPSPVPVPARPYQGRRAGIVTRTAAAIVDGLVVAVTVAGLYLAVAGVTFVLNPTNFHWPHHLWLSTLLIWFLIAVPYLTLTWCTTGRSYGDALFGVRVVNAKGLRMNVVGAALRAVLCVIFPIGLFWVTISGKNRSLQDIILRTSAIYDWMPQPELATSLEPVAPPS